MDIIISHANADFDCLGAMVAAACLYPGALLSFPGSQEKALRDLAARHPEMMPPLVRAKDVDLAAVRRLIIVDCQHAARIGRFAELLTPGGPEIHVYDHHPVTADSIAFQGGEIRSCGSTSTLLTTILIERNIALTPDQATLVLLGIHEDTGHLLYPTTTRDDYRAGLWLLERGASLAIVSDALSQELNSQQMALLKSLLATLRTTDVNGTSISVAHAASESYIADIAALAHLIRDMENLDTLFLAVEMENRIYLVARSRVSTVDAAAILGQFGGGGHAAAASASVRGSSLRQVLDRLEELLRLSVAPFSTVARIMSAPVKTMADDITITEAREMLTRYNCNAMPVMAGEAMRGIISRKTVEKALYHSLGTSPVTDFMHTDFMRAALDTPLNEIQRYMVEGNRRFVPVFDDGRLVGAVTRTDLLRHMYGGGPREAGALYDLGSLEHPARERSITPIITRRLPRSAVEMLDDLGAVGDELGVPVHAVGGFVRDLLLGVDNLDIDITVEGDGIFFAKAFADRHGCRVRSHETFGTAVVVFPDGRKVDVASTRLEFYESPGALPTVERSSLRHDLYRRDFTINTLAFCLNRDRFGRLTDYFGGQQDLQERVVRVLHNLSFVEDPTRVFRAIRFEQRLGFRMAPHTENLIRNAVRMKVLERVGGARLRNELVLMLRERDPGDAINRMASLGVLPFVSPGLKMPPEVSRVIAECSRVLAWFRLLFLDVPCEEWQVYFLALMDGLQREEFEATCRRLEIRERDREHTFAHRQRARSVLDTLQQRLRRGPALRDSELANLLRGLPLEAILYIAARGTIEGIRRAVSRYITTLRLVTCTIGGDELKRMGLVPGPRFGQIMQRLRDARLDREISSPEEERELAVRLITADGGHSVA